MPSRFKSLSFAVVVLAGALSQGAAGQSSGAQEISVVAPHVSVSLDRKRDAGQQRVRIYTVTRRVSFADLNLREETDGERLRERIRDAARYGCDAISKKHPHVQDDSCFGAAVDTAMIQANQLIAAARR